MVEARVIIELVLVSGLVVVVLSLVSAFRAAKKALPSDKKNQEKFDKLLEWHEKNKE